MRRALATTRALGRSPAAVLGASILALMIVVGSIGPLLLGGDPDAMDVANSFAPPTAERPFGTDEFGRDILTRVVHGTRISIGVGVAAVVLAALVGTSIGLTVGYRGGALDSFAMRGIDVMMAFPNLLLALAVIAVIGPGIRNTVIAVGVTFVPLFARMVRATVLRLKQEEYVVASRALGCSGIRTMWRHLLPNTMPTVIVTSTLVFGWAVLSVSSLSFIGLGVRPPIPEWGAMLSEARAHMQVAWWGAAAPAAALVTLILGANMLGDGLRQVLDPRVRF